MKYFWVGCIAILFFDLGYVIGHSNGSRQGIDEAIAVIRKAFQEKAK